MCNTTEHSRSTKFNTNLVANVFPNVFTRIYFQFLKHENKFKIRQKLNSLNKDEWQRNLEDESIMLHVSHSRDGQKCNGRALAPTGNAKLAFSGRKTLFAVQR